MCIRVGVGVGRWVVCVGVDGWCVCVCHLRCMLFVQVQPHMKKCFDNIKTLDMSKMRDKWEASHMNSTEGEKVEFSSAVHLEGAVEVGGL